MKFYLTQKQHQSTHRTRSYSNCLQCTFQPHWDSPHDTSKFSHCLRSTARSSISMWSHCFYCSRVFAWVTFFPSTTLLSRQVASQTSHNASHTFDQQQVLTNCWVCWRELVWLQFHIVNVSIPHESLLGLLKVVGWTKKRASRRNKRAAMGNRREWRGRRRRVAEWLWWCLCHQVGRNTRKTKKTINICCCRSVCHRRRQNETLRRDSNGDRKRNTYGTYLKLSDVLVALQLWCLLHDMWTQSKDRVFE